MATFNVQRCFSECEGQCPGSAFAWNCLELGVPEEVVEEAVGAAVDAQGLITDGPDKVIFLDAALGAYPELQDVGVDADRLDEVGDAVLARRASSTGCLALRGVQSL